MVHAFLTSCRFSIVFLLAFGVVCVCGQIAAVEEDLTPLERYDDGGDSIRANMEQSLKELTGLDRRRSELVKMVMAWRTEDGKPLLSDLKRRQDRALTNGAPNKAEPSDRGDVGHVVAKTIYEGMISNVLRDDDAPNFVEIVERKRGNPFDFAVLFKILADSQGLKTKVLEMINGPTDDVANTYPNVCCMVFLKDGKVVLVDFLNRSVSLPFVLSECYEEKEGFWRSSTRQKNNRGTLIFWDDRYIRAYVRLEDEVWRLSSSGEDRYAPKEVDEFIESCPKTILGYLTKASLFYYAHEWDKAVGSLGDLIRFCPDCAIANLRRAEIYSHRGDY
jgi:hypothetical protein